MNKRRIRQAAALSVLALSLLLLAASTLVGRGPVDTDAAARTIGRKVEKRMALLGQFMDKALSADPAAWLDLGKLPDDMVVYRYVGDTLQSWAHQFPIISDDIRDRTVFPRLGSSRNPLVSPLSEVGEKPGYYNFGPKWYLARAIRDGDGCLVIGGLEMVDELGAKGMNAVNLRLGLGSRFSLLPISASVGSSVSLEGSPLFKVAAEAVEPVRVVSNYLLFWLGVALFLIGTLLYLSCRRSLLRYLITLLMQAVLLAGVYFYGMFVTSASRLFSPSIYADGPLLYSLGAVLTVNLLLTLAALDTYLVRWTLLKRSRASRPRLRLGLGAGVLAAAALLLAVYIHTTFRSIVMNSGITLELYRIDSLSYYTAVVYLSFFLLAMALPLLVQMTAPAARLFFGWRYDAFSRRGRLVFSFLAAAYFVIASSVLGFRKEQNRVEVWSNRLAMDRDIGLEIQLRGIEGAVASDPVIAAVSPLQNSNGLIQNRLAETYMARLAQNYDISVINLSVGNDPVIASLLATRIGDGTQIADDSRFFYSRDMSGRARYAGVFSYYTRYSGTVDLLIGVEPKSNREDRGYLSLLGIAVPGRVAVPGHYSYAKYISGRLASYKGNYGYPTLLSEPLQPISSGRDRGTLSADGFIHFVHAISEDEVIVISRAKTEVMHYIVEGFLFAILSFFLITLVTRRRRGDSGREKRYYKTRINAILYVALILTLVAMAVFSVYFVYRRNDKDMREMMSSKINTIQTMVQGRLRQASSLSELRGQEVMGALEYTADVLKSDITLYSPSGRVFLTTTPEIFDRMIIGRRLNEDALYNIVYGHRRYYIHREQLSSHRFYTLYAPVFGSDGEMLAIVSSPYTDQNYDLETEAVSHIATIITAFLLLLILARFVTSAVIDRLFKPLSEMSAKMSVADIDHLEYIDYDQDDEITSLVTAYNRMVRDLSESTRKLAQAERDKAWSEMARQVAHEIKNPLTPIKLRLQMLIRMKASGNPAWEAKFDEVAGVVLDHIGILTETANEFSTFAKLYSEDPVPIDLDALLRDEVMIFSGRDDMDINYFGLEGARIEGPRPQLTRVLVNLITNSVQAIEGARAQALEAGRTPEKGVIAVSLRHSAREGYYDIVVEDNGPGVPEAFLPRLFTPNFTTKSGGTGLGLAISRTVIERCKGEISYERSFALGGAAFIVRYPKP